VLVTRHHFNTAMASGFTFCILLGLAVGQAFRTSDPCIQGWNAEPCICSGRLGYAMDMNCSAIQDGDSLAKIFHVSEVQDNLRFRTIEISGSNLKALPANVFGNQSFYLLFLSNNQLEVVDKDAFKGSEETAQVMRLNNNKLVTFPFVLLENLKNLQVLELEGNQLAEIPSNAFPQHSQLAVLNLSGNKIKTIGANAFGKLTKLTRLDLAANQLTSDGINDSSFSGLSSLESLDISNNTLSTLNEKIFGDLLKGNATIHVGNNPLNCEDTSMTWLKNLSPSTKAQLKNITC